MRDIGIEGARVHDLKVFRDPRGSFHEWFRGSDFAAGAGHDFDLRQANCAVSQRGVLRGLHFTATPPGQGKYLTCLHGSVLSAVVDIRVGSPTFGQSRTVLLEAGAGTALYVGEGLAHGFLSLSDDSVLIYLASAVFDPKLEHGLHPLDEALGIDWPAGIEPILSDKDATAPTLAEARSQGVLPDYADCPRVPVTVG
jgi:dTDP-4-dehydrorhamnose 3,5-epimerase